MSLYKSGGDIRAIVGRAFAGLGAAVLVCIGAASAQEAAAQPQQGQTTPGLTAEELFRPTPAPIIQGVVVTGN